MEIIHVIDALTMGGAEKLEVTFARAIRACGSRFTVVSLDPDHDTPIPAELERLDARVLRLTSPRLLDPQRIGRLVRLLRSTHYDVLQTHLSYANIIGALAGRMAGIPVIGTLHSAALDPVQKHPVKRLLETWALAYGAGAVVAVGPAVAAAHRARLRGARMVVIPNAVEPGPEPAAERRTRLRAELMDDVTGPLLVAVGRLAPPKGHFDLLSAFAAVHATHPSARLAIAGDGALHAALDAEIARLGLRDAVRLLGERDNVSELLQASDMFVSASVTEGLPLSLLEAMGAGLPVAATAVGDVPQVIAADTGVLVPPHEPARLADAIRSLLDDPARRAALGRNAREHVLRHYSSGPWFDQYRALYAQVVSRREKRPVQLPCKSVKIRG